MTQSGLIVAAGWAGAVVLLLGYAQTSRGRWTGDGPVFQACSIIGSASLALAAAAGGVWSSAVLNVAWLAIGVAVVTRRSLRPGYGGTATGTTTSATTNHQASTGRPRRQ